MKTTVFRSANRSHWEVLFAALLLPGYAFGLPLDAAALAAPAPAPDTTPPSVPTGLSATAASSSQVNLSWNAATDNVAVTGYRVFRCQGAGCRPTTQIATVTGRSYSNTGLSASTTYRYAAAAADAAGNTSAQSGSVSATTPSFPATSCKGISSGSGVVFCQDFDARATGTYSFSELKEDFDARGWIEGIEGAQVRGKPAVIVGGSDALSGNAVRATYPKGQISTGLNFEAGVPPAEEYYLGYWLRFDPGFDWQKGGKLPGLGAGTMRERFAANNKTGVTARLMWVGDGLTPYLYYTDMTDANQGYGIGPGKHPDFRFDDPDFRFERNKWYFIEAHIKLNSRGKSDGVYGLWVNGKKHSTGTGVRWRDDNQSFKIDDIVFHTYMGGGTLAWAPDRDNYSFFDVIIVSTKPISH